MSPVRKEFRAVIFDFGNVLCFPPPEARFAKLAGHLGLPLAEFLSEFWSRRIEYDRGEDARVYWQRFAGMAGRPLTDDLLEDLIRDDVALWESFDERVLGWANELRRAGLKTGILSNLPRTHGHGLRATPGFLEHFDHVTFSYELNMVKPEPGIYHHAVDGLGLTPGEALFLDDRPENVEGALAVGLPAHQFTTWEQFAAHELAQYRLPAPGAF